MDVKALYLRSTTEHGLSKQEPRKAVPVYHDYCLSLRDFRGNPFTRSDCTVHIRPDLFVAGLSGKVNIALGLPLLTPLDSHGVDGWRYKSTFRIRIFPPVGNQSLAGIPGTDSGPNLLHLNHGSIDIARICHTKASITIKCRSSQVKRLAFLPAIVVN